MSTARFLHELECLNLGILGPSITEDHVDNSMDAAFALLGPVEARKMKRKFRKVARKIISSQHWQKMSRRQKRNKVRRDLYMRCVLKTYNLGAIKDDNDP